MQVVAHNMLAQFSNRQLGINAGNKNKSSERLSSGYRINRSADDAAGLSISEKMRWQIRGLKKCDQNVQDGISLLQVADGGMNEIAAMLHRMRELTVQGLNDTNTEEDVAAIQEEIDALLDEIDATAERTTFNGIHLLQGDFEKVTEKTISTTTEEQVINMRYLENSILPGWVKVNGKSTDMLSGSTVGQMIQNNPEISAGTKQDTTLIKWVSDPNDLSAPPEGITDWTEGLQDNFAAVIDFSGLGSITGTTSFVVDNDINGDGVIDENDKVEVSNLWLTLNELVNTGFNTTCCTCSDWYGIVFTTKDRSSEIVGYPGWEKYWQQAAYVYIDDLLEKAQNDPTAGAEIAGELVQRVISQQGDAMNHFTQYAQDAANPAKLIVYDFRDDEPNVVGSQINGEFILQKQTEITIPPYTTDFVYEDVQRGLMIQTGAQEGDAIDIHFGNITTGGSGLNLRGKVNIMEMLYSYLTSTSTRTENYSYTVYDTEGYLINPHYYLPNGEEVLERRGTRIVNQRTITGTRTIVEENRILTGMSLGKNSKVLSNIDRAMEYLNDMRATIGAYQNRLEHTKQVVDNTWENTQAAESRLRDADIAKESVEDAKNNILIQASQAILAQANQSTQGILQLLQ